MFRPLIISAMIFLSLACSDDRVDYSSGLDASLLEGLTKYSPNGQADFYILPGQEDLSQIPQDKNNPLTQQKVELGRMLFFETGLANEAIHVNGHKTYSCASCHIPEAAFGPGRPQGIGDGGEAFGSLGEARHVQDDYNENEADIQAIRPLSLVNVAFVSNTFWNGQFGGSAANIGTEDVWQNDPGTMRNSWNHEAIEIQNIEGLKVHRLKMDDNIAEHYNYKNLFDDCFPGMPVENRYSNEATAMAISAYIRTILSDRAPFQEWLKGNRQAMSDEEKEGAILFFGKAKCASCHYEKNLGSSEFHVLGVKDMDQHPQAINPDATDKRHLGRGGFTLRTEDDHKFRVPGLYNISDSPFYFHGASKSELEDVIRYKMKALRENPRIRQIEMSQKLQKIDLTDEEINKLKMFLANSLRDPELKRYEADTIHSGLCYPNNDAESRMDLGCQ